VVHKYIQAVAEGLNSSTPSRVVSVMVRKTYCDCCGIEVKGFPRGLFQFYYEVVRVPAQEPTTYHLCGECGDRVRAVVEGIYYEKGVAK